MAHDTAFAGLVKQLFPGCSKVSGFLDHRYFVFFRLHGCSSGRAPSAFAACCRSVTTIRAELLNILRQFVPHTMFAAAADQINVIITNHFIRCRILP